MTARLALAGLAAAAAVVFAFSPPFLSHEPATTAGTTVAARPDRRTLPDGSIVELNAGAEIALAFTPDIRRVRLVRGEALFEVARNRERPFVVSTTAGVEVTAIGTIFAVRQGAGNVGVLVTEGSVAVNRLPGALATPATAAPGPIHLTEGDQLLVPSSESPWPRVAAEKLDPVRLRKALAWRGQRLEFTDSPVAEAVTLFNRQNQIQLSLEDAAVSRLRLNGIFWADDPEGFVRLLEEGMNVESQRIGDKIILRKRNL